MEFREELDRVFHEQSFVQGAATVQRGVYFLNAFPHEGKEDSATLVILQKSIRVPPEVKYLAYGVVCVDTGEIVQCGRTGQNGDFVATGLMLGKEYRVRYVVDVGMDIDKTILEKIDDAEARGTLEYAREREN